MTNYDLGYLLGVRPVIVIPKSEIAVDIKPVVNGSLDDIGTIVTIGTEKFYTIGTEGDNVKLLSMMNITLDDNPIQRLSAGKTVFSSEEKKE